MRFADSLEGFGGDIVIRADFPYLAAASALLPRYRPQVNVAIPLP